MLSAQNIERLRKIMAMGHRVGLHFHLQDSSDLDIIKGQIISQSQVLSMSAGVKIDRFSFHRPPSFLLQANLQIPGMINAYDRRFFTYSDHPEKADFSLHPKYIADSRNEWCYTKPYDYPCQGFFKAYPKIQILCHPYSWTEKGHGTLNNLKSLIQENKSEFIATLEGETKYVKEYLHEL